MVGEHVEPWLVRCVAYGMELLPCTAEKEEPGMPDVTVLERAFHAIMQRFINTGQAPHATELWTGPAGWWPSDTHTEGRYVAAPHTLPDLVAEKVFGKLVLAP
jgi:hypothetical protein